MPSQQNAISHVTFILVLFPGSPIHKYKNLPTREEPAVFSHMGDIKGGKDLHVIVCVHTEGQNSKWNERLVPCRQRTTHISIEHVDGLVLKFNFTICEYMYIMLA